MIRIHALPGTAVLCLAAALAVKGQAPVPQAPAQPARTFRSGIDLVTVDVTVLSRTGAPVDTLKAGDFTLLVDGAERPIVSVRLVESPSAPAPDTAAAPAAPAGPAADAATRRRFVIVVDRDHIPAGEGQQMLQAGAKFIDSLPPGDGVGLWTLPESRTALRFGDDREDVKKRLRLAVGTYRAPYGPWIVGRDEAIKADGGDRQVAQDIIARECYKQPQTCPGEVQAQIVQTAADARQRADATLAQLGVLVDALGSVEGPKHLVLLTGGPVMTLDNLGVISALARRAALARVTIHALQVAQPSYQARTDVMRAMPAEIDQSASAAYLLAGSTGGLAITPTSGEIGFGRLSQELSAGYVLVFETRPSDRDGKTHEISVKARDLGWGSLVRARKFFRVDPNAAAAPQPAPAPAAAPAPPPEPVGVDPGDMAGRLADYAEQFEREFAAVVAEERYVQVIHPWRGNPSGPQGEPALAWREPGGPAKQGGPIIARRQLVSDVVMVQLKDEQWLAYRDVAEVDGAPVHNRVDRMRGLLLSKAADRDDQFRRINMESARYNIGNLRREVNLPTVTLSLLRRLNHARFEFKRAKDEDVDGKPCRVLTYKEKARPTLIGTPNSGDILIYGRVWIDQADGRVRRTELRFERRSQGRSYIRVDFQPLEGLSVLVPALMWEWHEGVDQLGRIGGDMTVVQGLAAYAKLRRFQVTTAEEIK
jgi:VWFA-related protein